MGDENQNGNTGTEGQDGNQTGDQNQNDGQNANDNTGTGQSDGTTGSETGADNNNSGTGDDNKDKTSDTVTRAELERALSRMKAADQRASKAEAEVKKFEDANKSDLEKAQAAKKAADDALAASQAKLKQSAIRNAFLSNNAVTWHDPEDALRFANLDGVEVDDEGVVTDSAVIKKAIDDLAKKKPYLVKTATTEASGSGGNSGRKGETTVDKQKMESRFPALRTR